MSRRRAGIACSAAAVVLAGVAASAPASGSGIRGTVHRAAACAPAQPDCRRGAGRMTVTVRNAKTHRPPPRLPPHGSRSRAAPPAGTYAVRASVGEAAAAAVLVAVPDGRYTRVELWLHRTRPT